MFNYAGVSLGAEPAEVRTWVTQNIDPAWAWSIAEDRSWPGKDLMYGPWRPPRPKGPLVVGQLHWPVHASRFAYAHFLGTDDHLAAIRSVVYPGNGYIAAPLKMDDGTGAQGRIETEMYFLPPRPLGKVEGSNVEGLWLITLVDDRFFWWYRNGVIQIEEGVTTWQELYSDIGALLDVGISAEAISASFLKPAASLTTSWDALPVLLDAVAFSVGQRIVRKLDGTVVAQNPSTALASADAQYPLYPVLAGGRLLLTPQEPSDLRAAAPESVTLVYPTIEDGSPSADPTTYTVNLDDLPLAEYDGVHGFPGTRTIRSTANAEIEAAVVVNSAELQALAQVLASAYYRWQACRLDVALAGMVPWEPEGGHDVVWDHSGVDQCCTRIARGPWLEMYWDVTHLGSAGATTVIVTANVTNINNTVSYVNSTLIYDNDTIVFQGDSLFVDYQSSLLEPATLLADVCPVHTTLPTTDSDRLETQYDVANDDSWEDTGLSVSLPAAGDYLLQANAFGLAEVSAGAPGYVLVRLYDETAADSVTDSVLRVAYAWTTDTPDRGSATHAPLLFTAEQPTVIRLEAFKNTGPSWTDAAVLEIQDGGTRLAWWRKPDPDLLTDIKVKRRSVWFPPGGGPAATWCANTDSCCQDTLPPSIAGCCEEEELPATLYAALSLPVPDSCAACTEFAFETAFLFDDSLGAWTAAGAASDDCESAYDYAATLTCTGPDCDDKALTVSLTSQDTVLGGVCDTVYSFDADSLDCDCDSLYFRFGGEDAPVAAALTSRPGVTGDLTFRAHLTCPDGTPFTSDSVAMDFILGLLHENDSLFTGTVQLDSLFGCSGGNTDTLTFDTGRLVSVNGAGGPLYQGEVTGIVSVVCDTVTGATGVQDTQLNFEQGVLTADRSDPAAFDSCLAACSSPPGSPPSTNLVGWYAADAIMGLSDGDPIVTWQDQSSAGNDGTATGVTPAARPTWVDNVLGGKPVVRFSDGGRWFDMLQPWPQPITVVALWKRQANGNFNTILGSDTGGVQYRVRASPDHRQQFVVSGAVEDLPGSATFGFNEWTITAGAWTSSGGAYYRGTCADGAPNGFAVSPAIPGQIGKNGSSETWAGDVAEILVYDAELSAGDVEDAVCYLASKWGLL